MRDRQTDTERKTDRETEAYTEGGRRMVVSCHFKALKFAEVCDIAADN